jgi:hypothetical protein
MDVSSCFVRGQQLCRFLHNPAYTTGLDASTNQTTTDYVNFNAYNNAQEWMTLPRYNSSTGEYIGSISTVVDEVTVLANGRR